MENSATQGVLVDMGGDPDLPGELRDQLLALTVDRLSAGATLVTENHFQKTVEEGYHILTGVAPSAAIKTSLAGLIREVNENNPEILLLPGLENFITKSFMKIVRNMKWGVLELREQGTNEMRNYVKQGAVKTLMDQLKITPNQLNIRRCLSRIGNQMAGREDPQQRQAMARLEQLRTLARSRASAAARAQALPSAYISDPVAAPDAEEIQQWELKEEKIQAQMRKKQMANLLQNLDAYVKQGKLQPEDADRLRKVHKVDEAVKRGRISHEKGSRIRNSILTGEVRDKLDKKVREAVDYVVVYTQIFNGLKRIDPKYDEALRFLVRHKEIINADKIERAAMKPIISLLIEDIDCLHRLIEIMGREEAEVRMIASGLLPYGQIMRQAQDRIGNLVIEESFVDDLRGLSEDDLAARLNAPDKRLQLRAAADMMCMNVLIDRVIKATPFRKELRLLRINLIVEEFFRSSEDIGEAREKAEEFLRSRLSNLYPDMSREERAEMSHIGEEIIEAVAQKVQGERAEGRQKAEGGEAKEGEGGEAKEGELNREEIEQGVLIGRVTRRVAGGQRIFRQKIMPDTEDPSRFVLVQRDPESGEMVAIIRRGSKAYVEKNRDGLWEII